MKNRFNFVSRNSFFLGLVSLLNDAAGGIIVSALPLFLVSLGISPAGIGFMEGFAEGFSNILKGFAGFVEDKIEDKKKTALAGYSLTTITRIMYIPAQSFAFVFGIRILDRFGKAVREPARDALLAYSSDGKSLGKSFGLQRAMDTMGGIIGPLFATLVLFFQPKNFILLFVLAFIFSILSLFNFFAIKNAKVKIETKGNNILKSAKFRLFLLFTFIFALGNLPIVLLLLRVKELGGAAYLVPLMFFVYNISYAIFLFVAGILGDILKEAKVIIFGLIIGIISLFVFAVSANLLFLGLSFVLYGIFSGFTDTGTKALVGRVVEKEHFASSYGVVSGLSGLGLILSGGIGGYVWQQFSPFHALSLASLFLLVGLLVFILSFMKSPNYE